MSAKYKCVDKYIFWKDTIYGNGRKKKSFFQLKRRWATELTKEEVEPYKTKENLRMALQAKDNCIRQLLDKFFPACRGWGETESASAIAESSEELGGIFSAHLKAQRWDGGR